MTTSPTETAPFGLYIHIPWCIKKCPYCDFNSHQAKTQVEAGQISWQAYLDCLRADLQTELMLWRQAGKGVLTTVFIGGGTPSLAPGWLYQQLFDFLRANWPCSQTIEVTMEANPGAIDAQYFEAYRRAGINRLSIGVQSFNSQHLHALGRIHTAAMAHNAVATARRAGFDRLNLDLMFGLPQQTIKQGLNDVRQAIELAVDHISWYQLTIEPNTVFYRQQPLLDQDQAQELWAEGLVQLEQHGYRQYEVSAYAQAEQQCRHNKGYWQFADYGAIGAGAHGKMTIDGQIHRYHKTRMPAHYLQRLTQVPIDFVGQRHVLTQAQRVSEYFLNRLRLFTPITKAEYEHHTNERFADLQLAKLAEQGLLTYTSEHFELTTLGQAFMDDVSVTLCVTAEHL